MTGLALEDTGDHELPVDERHVPAILQYALFRFALRNGDLDAAGNLFALYLQLKASLPKHWTDEELLKFLNSAVREIIRRRPDCKECEYTEIGMDDTIPVSDKFETSLISYSVVRALEESGKKNVTEQHGYHVKKYEDGVTEPIRIFWRRSTLHAGKFSGSVPIFVWTGTDFRQNVFKALFPRRMNFRWRIL